MQVSERMTSDPKAIAPDDSIRRAAELMEKFDIGALPVCDEGRLVGIVTDRDITTRATALGSPPDSTNVSEVMTETVHCLPANSDVEEAERLMAAARIRRIPVVDGDRLVGILSLGDLAASGEREVAAVLQAVSRRED